MKRFLAMAAVLGLMVAPVMAEQFIVNPGQINMVGVNATMGTPTNVGSGSGAYSVIPVNMNTASANRSATPGDMYDNIPSVLGGLGTVGTGSTWAFFDWVGTQAEWMDYVTLAQTGTVRQLQYTYAGSASVFNTHTIRIRTGAIAPPSSVLGTFTGVGATIATIVLPSLPGTVSGGFVQMMVSGLSIPVGTTHVYVSFEEQGADEVFFLTGGLPGVGSVPTPNGELVYFNANYFGPSSPLSYNVPGYLTTSTGYFLNANINFALSTVPEPMTIGLMSIGGLLALRRRRTA